MRYKKKIKTTDILDQMTAHMLLIQFGTKRLEYNLLDQEYIVFNGDVIVWQGTDEKAAAKHYNKENSGLVT